MNGKKWKEWNAFLFFAFFFVVAIFSIVEKTTIKFIPEKLSPWITFISTISSVISFCRFLWTVRQKFFDKVSSEYERIKESISSEYDKIHETISSGYDKMHETISSIKGVLPTGKETDVVRKLLKMQLGDIAEKILPAKASFPVTLVPGGDVALIMNQQEYSDILWNLLSAIKNNQKYKICWTTFVPFESLNKNLSEYTSAQWSDRLINQEENFTPKSNRRFFDYVSKWASIENGQQIIILDTTEKEDDFIQSVQEYKYIIHPLNYQKYIKGNVFNLDLIKYLCVRYGVIKDNEFVKCKEGRFRQDDFKEPVIENDNNNPNVKWISLDIAQSITKDIQGRYDQKIYNIDFVYFDKPGNDFALVRVDADNSFSTGGGIVGVTFVVFASRSLKLYQELFNKMFERAEQTFKGLTGKDL